MKNTFRFFFISSFLIVLFVSESFGIPAFARKYSMSCQTCHSPFPKLKDYGDEFAKNGFILADKDAPRYFQETGDNELSLIRDIPLAFRLEGYATFKHKPDEDKLEFGSPRILKILSGGSLSKNLAYYFYFYLDEKGEIAGLEDAYLMFNNLFNSGVDFYIGQFQISDPLFKRELRLNIEDYHIYKKKIGKSNINLSYDRGIMLNYELPTKTDITFEALNGTGLIPAKNDNFDIDNNVNFFGRVSQELAKPLRIGGLVYSGKERLSSNKFSFINKVNMFGGDFTFSFNDKLEINYQYVYREDSQPDSGYSKTKTNGSFIEIIYTPTGDESKWYSAVLINYITSEFQNSDYKTLSLNIGYLLRRNFRLVGEFFYDFINKSNKISLGFVSAF